MRVDCEKWIYTTFKGDMHTEVSNHAKKVSFENREKLVIEEKIVLEQQLYSDSSSDSDEKIMVQKQQRLTFVVKQKYVRKFLLHL